MGYAAAPRVAFIVYGIQTFFTAIIIIIIIEREYKETKVKAAVKLFQNRDPVMKMVRDFEKHVESVGHQSLTKEAAK